MTEHERLRVRRAWLSLSWTLLLGLLLLQAHRHVALERGYREAIVTLVLTADSVRQTCPPPVAP
jgi:hypothetical protein